jgi:1-deoxyxylulose-5-phosphate synthase
MQTRYNMVYREEEREMIPLCLDQGVGVLPYSPLARGLLAGTRGRDGEGSTTRARAEQAGRSPAGSDFDVVDALRAVATDRAVPPAKVALAWLLRNPAVSAPIVGATKASHLDDAVAALEVTLSDEEVTRLESGYLPHEPYGYS